MQGAVSGGFALEHSWRNDEYLRILEQPVGLDFVKSMPLPHARTLFGVASVWSFRYGVS